MRINQVIRGWINYFRMGNMKECLRKIDEHLRTRIRIVVWKQWKTRRETHMGTSGNSEHPYGWRKKVRRFGDYLSSDSKTTGLRRCISKEILVRRGLLSCFGLLFLN